jgi:hypothetical protein
MPVWDVSRLPERDQFDYWRGVICQAFVPLMPGRKEPGPGFASTVETRPLLVINRARIASRVQTTRHGPREVAATDDAFYLVNLPLAGRCRTRVGTTDTVVRPGQFVQSPHQRRDHAADAAAVDEHAQAGPRTGPLSAQEMVRDAEGQHPPVVLEVEEVRLGGVHESTATSGSSTGERPGPRTRAAGTATGPTS